MRVVSADICCLHSGSDLKLGIIDAQRECCVCECVLLAGRADILLMSDAATPPARFIGTPPLLCVCGQALSAYVARLVGCAVLAFVACSAAVEALQ